MKNTEKKPSVKTSNLQVTGVQQKDKRELGHKPYLEEKYWL